MPQLPSTENPKPDSPPKVDLAVVARDLKLPPENVEKAVQLLDDGNTIPFVTRFRKDLTGGLNEKQILAIKQRVSQLRALSERKAFVLKSIESQGKLTDDLRLGIHEAQSSRRLEDLYLPYKSKKQTKAAIARQQGLETLALDILTARETDVDLATRATDFVRVDKGLNSVDDVIKGVGDLLVERFGENSELRSTLRQVIWNTGKLVSHSLQSENSDDLPASPPTKSESIKTQTMPGKPSTEPVQVVTPEPQDNLKANPSREPEPAPPISSPKTDPSAGTELPAETATESPSDHSKPSTEPTPQIDQQVPETVSKPLTAPDTETETDSTAPSTSAAETGPDTAPVEQPSAVEANEPSPAVGKDAVTSSELPAAEISPGKDAVATDSTVTQAAKKKKKKKKKKKTNDPFKDFHDFQQPLNRVPHHRVLAINRGERAGKLKVKVRADDKRMYELASSTLVPENHPFSEFLNKCSADAVAKVIFPSLEREVRRELTEAAEKHAVDVFANNLRHLLLQPPIRDSRVLAIDPGFKRGCSVAVLDSFGHLVESGHVFVVGNHARRDESKQRLVDWIQKYDIDVVGIGNGAACRQAEQLVSDAISEHLSAHKVQYVMVNEAGASIYSTSEIGREELPDVSPAIRSAVSIGRRIQDPLSELVKISPANIGVGMYQHDVKAKHLSDSLDEVVAFCVNQVGVNANTAGVSLLKYVSGLNALTARRLIEYRQEIGGFKNREQLKQVNGIGDATFVQAAGFLRLPASECPLDSTGIHPESYEVANSIIQRMGLTAEELFPSKPDVVPPPRLVPPSKEQANKENLATTTESPESATQQPPGSDPEATPTVGDPNATSETETNVALQSTADQASESMVDAESVTEPLKTPPGIQPGEPQLLGDSQTISEEPSGKPEIPEPESSVAASDSDPKTEATPEAAPPSSGDPENTGAKPAENSPLRRDRKEIIERISKLDINELANELSAGKLLVRDIVLSLRKPEWDPRDRTHKPIFRRGIIKVDDLKPEMQLDGQIVNVVDFGVFVDIGLGESSLVHVSQLSNHYVRDPHRFCSVGEVIKVWVSEVDAERRRVKLTAIRPGSKTDGPPAGRHSGKSTRQHAKKPGHVKAKGRGPVSRRPQQQERSRRRKPQNIPPITDGMLKGKEPMRSFSDLAQFVNQKPEDLKDKDKPKEE